jgi:hypothetical protein
MFRLAPLHALRESGVFAAAAQLIGRTSADAPRWLGWALLPLWLVGYFGLAGACALVWFARSWRTASASETWLALCGLCATVMALLLGAPGYSQLFFLYTGQVGLAVLAAMALDRGLLPRRPLIAVGVVLGLPLVLAAAIAIAGEVRRDLRKKEPNGLSAAYYEGLAWIRAHTPEDAILVAQHGEMLESVHAERAPRSRRTEQYTPAAHARGWQRGPKGWLWSPDYSHHLPRAPRAAHGLLRPPRREHDRRPARSAARRGARLRALRRARDALRRRAGLVVRDRARASVAAVRSGADDARVRERGAARAAAGEPALNAVRSSSQNPDMQPDYFVRPTTPADAEQNRATLARRVPESHTLVSRRSSRQQVARFSEGQLVVVQRGTGFVVGMTSHLALKPEWFDGQPGYEDLLGGWDLPNHVPPARAVLYTVELMIHPQHAASASEDSSSRHGRRWYALAAAFHSVVPLA